MNGDPRSILLAPVVSEKSYGLIAERHKYTFKVHPKAHKTQIRQAVEQVFQVTVLDVNVSKVPAKPKRRGGHSGTRPGWKKAVVTVAEGQTIEAFGPGGPECALAQMHRSIECEALSRSCVLAWLLSPIQPSHEPGRRFMSVSDFEEITKTEPEKTLLAPKPKNGGRNNNGRITTRHQGGGHKQRYRIIDFKRKKDGVCRPRCTRSSTTPTAPARIALLHYADGEKRYILAPTRLTVGQTVESGPNVDIKPGNALPLAGIPTGTTVHNVELRPGQGGKMVRSAGGSAQLVAKEGGMALLRLPSGEMRRVQEECRATIGQLGNETHQNESGGKAGRSRWKGKRPTVRGTAMNPVDHPHGGGEGKNKGSHPVTPWGKPTLGYRTRNKKKASTKDIVRSRKRGKGGR